MEDTLHWDPRSFWSLIESSGRSLRTLGRKLELFSKFDLCRYRVAFDNKKSEVNPHCWEECHPYLAEPRSEDDSDDFAAWVVMQGKEFYEEVAAHPDRIEQYLEMFGDCEASRGYGEMRWDDEVDRNDYLGFRRADYIASAIYHSISGENILEACYDNRGWPREGME